MICEQNAHIYELWATKGSFYFSLSLLCIIHAKCSSSQFRYYVFSAYRGAKLHVCRNPSRIQITLAFSSDLSINSYHNIKVQPVNFTWIILDLCACRIPHGDGDCEYWRSVARKCNISGFHNDKGTESTISVSGTASVTPLNFISGKTHRFTLSPRTHASNRAGKVL